MPIFEITAPDGKTYEVEGPDGSTPEQALAILKKRLQPQPAKQPEMNLAARDTGMMEAGLIGAGRTIDRVGKGLKQGALEVGDRLGFSGARPELDRMKTAEDENTRYYGDLQKAQPVSTFIGEALPMLAAIPAAGSVAGAALAGALPGALEYGSLDERAGRAVGGAVGGGLGTVAGKMVGRAVQPFRPPAGLNQTGRDAADRLGVQLRPGEITGSKPMQWMESVMNDLPFSASMAEKAQAARQGAINRAGARSIGQTANLVTEDVLANARGAISGVFDSVLSKTRVHLDPQFQAEVKHITNSKVMKVLRDEDTQAIIAPFQNMPQGGRIHVDGDWFQANKTALNDAIRGAYTAGQPGKARALEKFENALDDAATRSMSSADRRAYDAARKQWANLRALEAGQVVEAGNVVPSRVDAVLRNRYKAAYKEGKINGPLADVGRLSQAYKALPQSGTAPRALYQGIAAGSAFANPLGTLAALAAPPIAQKFMQSNAGRHYLTKGMANITPEMEKLLMRGGFGLLGAPAMSGQ